MARRPLAALLVLLAAASAAAQTAATTPADQAAARARSEIARAFASGADLRAVDVAALREPAAAPRVAELLSLREQAQYVQAGRELGDTRESFLAMLRSVTRRLDADWARALALYGDRVRPARLIAASSGEVGARAALAEDVRRNPAIPSAVKSRIAKDLRETSENLMSGSRGDGSLVVAYGVVLPRLEQRSGTDWNSILPRVQPLSLTTDPTPFPENPPAATSEALTWGSLLAYLDWDRGRRVAEEAFTGTLHYVRTMGLLCYRFVKKALIDAGVLRVPNPESSGLVGLRPGAARMFSEDVRRHPEILETMGYRRVDLANAGNDPSTIPDGSMLIYAGGCGFASAEYGHAELTVSEAAYAEARARNPRLRPIAVDFNEIRVCHFTCTKRSMPFLRTYGRQGCLSMYVPVKPA